MLIRTIYLQLAEGHRSDKGRRDVANASRLALASLPYVRGVHAAVPLEIASAKGWDVAIHLRFDDAEGIAGMEALTSYAEWREQVLGDKLAFEKTWTWQMV